MRISLKVFWFVFIFCSFGKIFSQGNPSLNQLNSYKYFVLKDENTVVQYKDTIAKKVLSILKHCNFPAPLDQSVLYSNKFDQCHILTLVYSVTSASYSSGEIACSFKFIDCNYATLVSNEIHEKTSFLNEKNYIKTVAKCFNSLEGFQYKYASKEPTLATEELASQEKP